MSSKLKSFRLGLRRLGASFVRTMPNDRLARRAELKATIADCALGGRLLVHWYSTDCDHFTRKGYAIIPATVTHYIGFRNDLGEDAEGPTYAFIQCGEESLRETWEQAHDRRLCGLRGGDFQYFMAMAA